MLNKHQMQEIQNLKILGYTKTDIQDYYRKLGGKVPSRPTISKYYDMDVVPDNPGERLIKEKAFDTEPFKEAILSILKNNERKDFCVSSVYDVLLEKFIENGNYETLPGNEQTLRNYIHYLETSGQYLPEEPCKRVYDHVFDTPPGEQMLIDFGETKTESNRPIFFICLLLRYSRFLCVYAQDHKYNSLEACQAIYRSFCRLGGRPSELVIDQDAVFVASETYGEVIKTRIFEDFCTEQSLKLWVCNKADPQSKGAIENSVGFVKKNFFSARKITSIDDVWRSLPGWLERKNHRIHKATYRIPDVIFHKIEKASLRPLLPSVYEDNPNSFTDYECKGQQYIQYKACHYSVPREYAYHTVKFKVVGSKIHIYDSNFKYICSHTISECKGSYSRLEEHTKPDDERWNEIVERLRSKWNCCDFQHFVNGVKKENPRHLTKQFRAIEQFLDSEKPERSLVAIVLKHCCEDFRYRFTQFKAVYEYEKAVNNSVRSRDMMHAEQSEPVEYKDMGIYGRAFNKLVDETIKEA